MYFFFKSSSGLWEQEIILTKNLFMPPSGHPNYNPCGKLNGLVDHANKNFREQYTPHCQLGIYDSLVGTHCHSIIKQYLPNKKHHKWGIGISSQTFSIRIRKFSRTQTVKLSKWKKNSIRLRFESCFWKDKPIMN